MSATQSKAKMLRGKPAAYYGRVSAGSAARCSSEMTCSDTFSLARLQAFSFSDFEAYRARGEEFRHRLSGAVLHALNLSDVWNTDCECRSEWGGLFPVHLRLTHNQCRHVTLDILSPSNESPFWHGLIWINTNHTGLYFWNAEQLEPESIGKLLQRIDELVRAGFDRPGDIAAVLRRGGMN